MHFAGVRQPWAIAPIKLLVVMDAYRIPDKPIRQKPAYVLAFARVEWECTLSDRSNESNALASVAILEARMIAR